MARYEPCCLDVVLCKHLQEPPNADCSRKKTFVQVSSVLLSLPFIAYLLRCRLSSPPRHKTQAILRLRPKPSIVSVCYLQDTSYGIDLCVLWT